MAERPEGWDVVGEYEDEAKSAYHGSRGEGLARAREHAARVAADEGRCVLVVQHTDRLARGDGIDADHLIDVAMWARKASVSIRSVQDDSTCENLIMTVVMGERNHEDSRRKGLAVKDGLKRRVVDRKQHVGGRRPFGYAWVGQCDNSGAAKTTKDGRIIKCLEPVPAEEKIVRRIFADFLAGASQRSIAISLNEGHVPTVAGGTWYATTVAGMLKNPLFIGQVTLAGEHYRAEHKPLIDRETWDKARQLREARKATGRPLGRRTTGRTRRCTGSVRAAPSAVEDDGDGDR